jgi:hypothetical protein
MFLKSVTPRHVVCQTCRAQAACIQECEKVDPHGKILGLILVRLNVYDDVTY